MSHNPLPAQHSHQNTPGRAGRTVALALVGLLLWGAGTFTASAASAETLEGTVAYVFDGDTVSLDTGNHKYRIRLARIDAPEISHADNDPGQPYGQESRRALRRLVSHAPVTVKVSSTDQYGRKIGDIYSQGRYVNLAMVKQGAAWAYERYNDRADITNAQHHARANQLGLWAANNPQPPWDFRHNGPRQKQGPDQSRDTNRRRPAIKKAKKAFDKSRRLTREARNTAAHLLRKLF